MQTRLKQKGVAAVELGLLLIPLTTIAFGVTEFGRAIYQYNSLDKSVRNAVRYLSGQAANTFYAEARNLVVYGNIAGTGPVLVPGLTTAMVDICDAVTCTGTHSNQSTGVSTGAVNLVTVSVGGGQATSYTFQSLVSFVVPNIIFGPISVTMRQ